MAAILDFTTNAMSKVFFDHNTMSGTPFKPHSSHQNQESVTILKKIISNGIQFIVSPCRNGDILDFTHNAMSKVHYGHTNMSGIPEIPYMIDTKIVNMLLFC